MYDLRLVASLFDGVLDLGGIAPTSLPFWPPAKRQVQAACGGIHHQMQLRVNLAFPQPGSGDSNHNTNHCPDHSWHGGTYSSQRSRGIAGTSDGCRTANAIDEYLFGPEVVVEVWQRGTAQREVIDLDGELSGADILPGFSLPLKRLFSD